MDTKIQAAIAWLITGDSVAAGRLCDVPDRTIRFWMKEPWWEDVLDQAKGIKQKELDALFTGILHTTADKLRDRLTDGDPVLNKFGDIKYVPVKAKDLAIIMQIAVDKRSLLRGQATSRSEKITTDQRLAKIGDKFQEVGAVKEEEEEAKVAH